MGTWDCGYFDNDSACDVLDDLLVNEVGIIEPLVKGMQMTVDDEYFEEITETLITALLLLLWKNKELRKSEFLGEDRIKELTKLANRHRSEAEAYGLEKLTRLCSTSLIRITEPKVCEVAELWRESDDESFNAWRRGITTLHAELN